MNYILIQVDDGFIRTIIASGSKQGAINKAMSLNFEPEYRKSLREMLESNEDWSVGVRELESIEPVNHWQGWTLVVYDDEITYTAV